MSIYRSATPRQLHTVQGRHSTMPSFLHRGWSFPPKCVPYKGEGEGCGPRRCELVSALLVVIHVCSQFPFMQCQSVYSQKVITFLYCLIYKQKLLNRRPSLQLLGKVTLYIFVPLILLMSIGVCE